MIEFFKENWQLCVVIILVVVLFAMVIFITDESDINHCVDQSEIKFIPICQSFSEVGDKCVLHFNNVSKYVVVIG